MRQFDKLLKRQDHPLDAKAVGELFKVNKPAAARFLSNCPTMAEGVLWEYIQKDGFQTQVVLHGYIVDFYHPEVRLAVEVDGSSHWHKYKQDRARDGHLWDRGIGTLRFNNREVIQQPARVAAKIRLAVEELRRSPLTVPPAGKRRP